jgi:hypothetical protein
LFMTQARYRATAVRRSSRRGWVWRPRCISPGRGLGSAASRVRVIRGSGGRWWNVLRPRFGMMQGSGGFMSGCRGGGALGAPWWLSPHEMARIMYFTLVRDVILGTKALTHNDSPKTLLNPPTHRSQQFSQLVDAVYMPYSSAYATILTLQ